jgi:hypothetical protein
VTPGAIIRSGQRDDAQSKRAEDNGGEQSQNLVSHEDFDILHAMLETGRWSLKALEAA